jgi:Protein of unknown function (DUF3987)
MDTQSEKVNYWTRAAYPRATFKQLDDAGFLPELLPLLPIDAKMSPDSSLSKPDPKIPGGLKTDGTWVGYPKWTSLIATPMHIKAWDDWKGAGIGLRASRVSGLDLDCRDEQLCDALEKLAREMFGDTIVRFGNYPKRLLPFRISTPINKVRLEFTKEGSDEKPAIEILGHRQQFVLEAIHPKTGLPYWWERGAPAAVGFEGLPLITPEKYAAYLEVAIKLADGLGWKLIKKSAGERHERQGSIDVRLDLPANIERATTHVKNAVKAGGPPVEDRGSDDRTYKLACTLFDLGLSGEKIVELLKEHWAPHFDEEWLEQKVNNASAHKQNADGCYTDGQRTEETFKEFFENYKPSDGDPADDAKSDDAKSDDASAPFDDERPFNIFTDTTDIAKRKLPDNSLPPVIEAYAKDQAELMGISPGPIAFAAITSLAPTIHGGYLIQPTNNSRFRQRSVLWSILVGDPTTIKTPILEEVTIPHYAIQLEWAKHDELLFAQYQQALKDWEAKRGRRSANIREAPEIGEKLAGSQVGPPPRMPLKRRLVISDATKEGISKVQSRNVGRGLLSARDELSGWITGMDLYRDKKNTGYDRAAWLEAFDSKTQIVDRSVAESGTLENWHISVQGGIQPDRITPIAKQLSSDGLLQRFMIVYSDTPNSPVDRDVNAQILSNYHSLVRRLTELKPDPGEPVIRLSPAASEQWQRVMSYVDARKVLNKSHAALGQHLGKWPKIFARLLLVYHAIECVSTLTIENPYPRLEPLVAGETAERAANLAIGYLTPNAEKFYRSVFSMDENWSRAYWIANYILTHQSETIRPRDVYNNFHDLMGKPKELQEVMILLEHWQWIKPKEIKPVFGVTEWWVNPRIYEMFEEHRKHETAERTKAKAAIKLAAAISRREDELFVR